MVNSRWSASRRAWLVVLAGLPLAAIGWRWRRPSPPRPVRVAVFSLTDVDDATLAGFKAGMARLGYREGAEIVYRVPGPAGRIDLLDAYVTGEAARDADLILVSSTPATQAVLRAGLDRRVPVIFAPVNDPLRAGIVASLRAPGGNVTGIRLPPGDALRLQWLLRVAPAVRRVWMPYTAADASARESLRQMGMAADALGVTLLPTAVADFDTLPPATPAAAPRTDAVLVLRDSTMEARIDALVERARAWRQPLCVPGLRQVERGALLSYGFVHYEIGQQAAGLAAQILGGVPAGDLPVLQARDYLAINLRAARAIGLHVPRPILRLAHVLIREDGAASATA